MNDLNDLLLGLECDEFIHMREKYWYLVNEEWAAEARVGCKNN